MLLALALAEVTTVLSSLLAALRNLDVSWSMTTAVGHNECLALLVVSTLHVLVCHLTALTLEVVLTLLVHVTLASELHLALAELTLLTEEHLNGAALLLLVVVMVVTLLTAKVALLSTLVAGASGCEDVFVHV